MQLDIDRLIRDFGGVTALADALTFAYPADPVSRAAVYKWRARGSLPLSQLQKLTRIAADRGWKRSTAPALLAKAVGPIATAAASGYNTKTGPRTPRAPLRMKGCARQTGARLWEVHNV